MGGGDFVVIILYPPKHRDRKQHLYWSQKVFALPKQSKFPSARWISRIRSFFDLPNELILYFLAIFRTSPIFIMVPPFSETQYLHLQYQICYYVNCIELLVFFNCATNSKDVIFGKFWSTQCFFYALSMITKFEARNFKNRRILKPYCFKVQILINPYGWLTWFVIIYFNFRTINSILSCFGVLLYSSKKGANPSFWKLLVSFQYVNSKTIICIHLSPSNIWSYGQITHSNIWSYG